MFASQLTSSQQKAQEVLSDIRERVIIYGRIIGVKASSIAVRSQCIVIVETQSLYHKAAHFIIRVKNPPGTFGPTEENAKMRFRLFHPYIAIVLILLYLLAACGPVDPNFGPNNTNTPTTEGTHTAQTPTPQKSPVDTATDVCPGNLSQRLNCYTPHS